MHPIIIKWQRAISKSRARKKNTTALYGISIYNGLDYNKTVPKGPLALLSDACAIRAWWGRAVFFNIDNGYYGIGNILE